MSGRTSCWTDAITSCTWRARRSAATMAPIWMSAMTSVATAMTPRNTSDQLVHRLSPPRRPRRRRAPARTLPGRARSRARAFRAAVHELAPLARRFARPLASFARLLARASRRVSSPLAGAISSATAAPVIAPSTNATTTVPAAPPSSRHVESPSFGRSRADARGASEDADPHVQVLLRDPSGSSAMSACSSLAAPFMFSYNCLSCSSCPAVPSPSFRFASSARRSGRPAR